MLARALPLSRLASSPLHAAVRRPLSPRTTLLLLRGPADGAQGQGAQGRALAALPVGAPEQGDSRVGRRRMPDPITTVRSTLRSTARPAPVEACAAIRTSSAPAFVPRTKMLGVNGTASIPARGTAALARETHPRKGGPACPNLKYPKSDQGFCSCVVAGGNLAWHC